ncbi:MAG: DUF2905 domain-containing protein [Dehalococcoidia bacterium]|nr:DUF2905 domain-containing protein [Dehalococcoidia bacterium]
MDVVARSLIIFGVVIALVGVLLLLAPHVPLLGKLPGDFSIKRNGFSFYFPLTTMILVSLLLTIVANVVFRLISR